MMEEEEEEIVPPAVATADVDKILGPNGIFLKNYMAQHNCTYDAALQAHIVGASTLKSYMSCFRSLVNCWATKAVYAVVGDISLLDHAKAIIDLHSMDLVALWTAAYCSDKSGEADSGGAESHLDKCSAAC